ncbi:MAG: hypothetical protein GTO02_13720, partial [Candidatus Dadabacteria bacterium]|nr:hypothetical protein [Candidatus Dadabacteria bacterium]
MIKESTYKENYEDLNIKYSNTIFRDTKIDKIGICKSFEEHYEDSCRIRYINFKNESRNLIYKPERFDFTRPTLGCRNYEDTCITITSSIIDGNNSAYRKGLSVETLVLLDPFLEERYKKLEPQLEGMIGYPIMLNKIFSSAKTESDFYGIDKVLRKYNRGAILNENFMVVRDYRYRELLLFRLKKVIGKVLDTGKIV